METADRRSLWVLAACAAVALALAVRWLGGDDGGERVALTPPPGGGAAGVRPPGEGAAASGVWVHVAGAVRSPGVYRVPREARVAQAVELAGGPARRANLAGVNLAAPVADGQQVVVPARERGAAGAAAAAGGGRDGGGAVAGGGAAGGAAPGAEATISLATATVEQLEALDGIGPTLARRIVEYRDARGGFRSLGELREVDGIGEKRFEALRRALRP